MASEWPSVEKAAPMGVQSEVVWTVILGCLDNSGVTQAPYVHRQEEIRVVGLPSSHLRQFSKCGLRDRLCIIRLGL